MRRGPAASLRPPKPRFVLNIGITGHRHPRLPVEQTPEIARAIREIVTAVAGLAPELAIDAGLERVEGAGALRLVTSLAEGADRIAAHVALELGVEIQAPLPFSRGEYERDFETPESRAEYRELLAAATAVLELDGRRDDEATAYLHAGRVMLEQSDLLLAVMDDDRTRKRGGTAHIVSDALAKGIPVIRIRPHQPADPDLEPCVRVEMLGAHRGRPWPAALRERLHRGLVGDAESIGRRARYFRETERRTNYGAVFTWFRNVVCLRKPWGIPLRLPPYLETGRAEAAKTWREHSELPEAVGARLHETLLPHYAWADHLALYYMGAFRCAYLFRYLFGVVAMTCAVIGSFSALAWQGFALQILSVVCLIVLVSVEKKKQWHLRALEYRLLAEQLRALHFIFPLGWGVERLSRFDGGLRAPPPWIEQLLRGMAREAGLVSAAINPAYLKAHRKFFCEVQIEAQAAYHRTTARWQAQVADRLFNVAMLFFLLGLAGVVARAAVYHLYPQYARNAAIDSPFWQGRLSYWIKVLTIFFPTLGAAVAAVRTHGEFLRLSSRSVMMVQFFEAKKSELDACEEADWEETLRLTREIAGEMLGELIDWRTLIAGKGLSLPV
ncbi:MAG TPA: hypothetical protein VNQ90_07055 [Chthoniobacteraceae bacterium]|nr:hypothetical protein [Chthoniobacteraceae bacterium]